MISPPVCSHFNSDCYKETLRKYWLVHLIYMGQINEDMCFEATEARIVYSFIVKYLHVYLYTLLRYTFTYLLYKAIYKLSDL